LFIFKFRTISQNFSMRAMHPTATKLRLLMPAVMLTIVPLTPACRSAREILPSCPPGAVLMGAPPPRGEELWCQKTVDGKPVKSGAFILYGESGGRVLEGSYQDGKQDGEWTMWYANGQRASIDHYRDGMHDGPHISWYANGNKAIEGEFHNGKRQGAWTRWDPSGLKSEKLSYGVGEPAD
jgi:hypothetical protein